MDTFSGTVHDKATEFMWTNVDFVFLEYIVVDWDLKEFLFPGAFNNVELSFLQTYSVHFSGVGGGVQKILFSKEGGNETDTFFPERGGGFKVYWLDCFSGGGAVRNSWPSLDPRLPLLNT